MIFYLFDVVRKKTYKNSKKVLFFILAYVIILRRYNNFKKVFINRFALFHQICLINTLFFGWKEN